MRRFPKAGGWTYREMEDNLAAALSACAGLPEMRKVHARMVALALSQSNFLATKLVLACAAAAEMAYAEAIFSQVAEPNTFLFNAMIRAYSHNAGHADALALYKAMLLRRVAADRFTHPFVLKACGALALPALGTQVHAHTCKFGLDSAPVVENSLLEMYARSRGDHLLSDARKVFDKMAQRDAVAWNTLISAHARRGQMGEASLLFEEMPEKSVISWTALISGHAGAGGHAAALEVFHRMQRSGAKPDHVTLVSVLPACARLGALEMGRWIHAFADRNSLLGETQVCNALVEMYSKCGSLREARQMFDRMPRRDVVSWSAMIGGLAHHGRAAEAVELFEAMRVSSVEPNGVTLLGVLSACAHAGLTDKGMEIFASMARPGVEHYGCVVDLLGRAGHVRRARQMIEEMPVPADAAIWGSLLGACRTHGDAETAAVAAERLLELEPEDAGNCVLLSNVYAAAGSWEGVSRLRKEIRSRNMRKTPGCSSIEVGNLVKEFVAGRAWGPDFSEISAVLELLASQLGGEEEDPAAIGNHG